MSTQSANDRVTIYLAIESADLTPSSITAQPGAFPNRVWLVGDARGKTGKRWEHNGWVVETTARSEESEGRAASELIPIVLKEFQGRVAPFANQLRC